MKRLILGLLLCGLSVSHAATAAPEADLWERWTAHDDSSEATIDHAAWTEFLGKYLREDDEDVTRLDYGGVEAADRERLDRAIDAEAATAVLVKMNQAGTITRTIDVMERAMDAGLSTVVSARSGETCDSTMADLAVAYGAGQLKVGSLARSERLAKYNRLFEIENERDPTLSTF